MLFIAKLSGVYPEQPAQITIITYPDTETEQYITTDLPIQDETDTTISREQKIANDLGIDVPVTGGSCSSVLPYTSNTVLACFVIPDNIIYITDAGFLLDDNTLKCVLNHEKRHVEQFRSGMWHIENNELINREQLEADAIAFDGC